MYFQSNLKQLALTQASARKSFQAIVESDYALEQGEIQFLSIAFSAPEVSATALPQGLNLLILYGMGDGHWVRRLLTEIKPTTMVWILDPQPALAWIFLNDFDLQDIVADPRVTWRVDSSERLIAEISKHCRDILDQYGSFYLENPLIASIGERFQNPLLHYLRQENLKRQQLPSLDSLHQQLKHLYQALEPPMQQAYQKYDLTCKQGCADCCKSSVGYHLCINPLEWKDLYSNLWQLPESERKQIYQQSVISLAQHSAYLVSVLDFFDRQPERFYKADFHLELLKMAGDERKQACVFLGKDDNCQVYQGRPLTCRIFGNSYGLKTIPFTCDKDGQLMEQIILDEGQRNQLVSATPYRQRLRDLHQTLPFKQVINAWVFTHLDFENADFLPDVRLDYQQFQQLVRRPNLLAARLQSLTQAAQTLA